jgi:O-antigen ligase
VNGKGAQALFLFFGVLVSAWASGRADAAVWHWALSLALFAAALYPPSEHVRTWEGAAVAAFVLWAVFHTLFVTQSYSPAGLFQPLFLATGFALGRRAFERSSEHAWAYAWGWAIVAITCYALLDAGYTGASAAAPFETPAVLTALINLALLPALAHALWGPRASRSRFIALTVLVAGLIAAASRGGWIGLLVGFAATLIVFRGRIPAARNAVVVAAAVFSAAGLVVLIRFLGASLAGQGASLAGQGAAMAGRSWAGLPALFLAPSVQQMDSSFSRLELYALAIDRIGQEFPLGSGYLSFAQILEAGRERVPSYGTENVTFFVHNDYLQTLLELGVPGLCALVALVLLPLVFLLRDRARYADEDLVLCGGCAGGIAAMAFQAGVDFPLYIPACLAGFGFLLGALAARSAAAGTGVLGMRPGAGALGRIAVSARRIGLATGIVLLLVPLAAEWSLAYGQARWRQGFGQEAAYGFELARRLQPGDWRYAWYAGKFWTAQAASERNPKAAILADTAFASGFAANRLEVKNLLGRIELQRSLPQLLERRASVGELEAWSVKAMELAPRNARVRIERIFVLERAGKIAAAHSEAVQFALDEPGNRAARFLAARLAGRRK